MRNEQLKADKKIPAWLLKSGAITGLAAAALSLGGCYQEKAGAEAPQSQGIETSAPQESGEQSEEQTQPGEGIYQNGEFIKGEPADPFVITFNTDGSVDNEKTCADFSTFMNAFNQLATKTEVNSYVRAMDESRGPDDWALAYADTKIDKFAPVFFGEDYKNNPNIQEWLAATRRHLDAGTRAVLMSTDEYDPENKEILTSEYTFPNCVVTADKNTKTFSLSTDNIFTTNSEMTKLDIPDKSGHWKITGVIDDSGKATAETFDY